MERKRENCGLLSPCLRHAAKRAAALGSCVPAPKTESIGGFMKLKIVVCLLGVLSLFGVAAHAQDVPKIDVFAGYSYLQANPGVNGVDSFHLNGGSASVAYNVKDWLSGVADFGGYTNGNILGTGSGTLSTYMFGPRVTYRHFGRITPFGQVLFGVAHAGSNAFDTTGSQNAFAMAVGGGVDYRLLQHLALRPFQVDYLMTRFGVGTTGTQTQNNLRVSTGVVFRF
jgi:opacity protein-like surface antigen